jgi:recombinational DNA repair protein RecR
MILENARKCQKCNKYYRQDPFVCESCKREQKQTSSVVIAIVFMTGGIIGLIISYIINH